MPLPVLSSAFGHNESKLSVLELVRLNLNKMLARKIVKTFEEDPSADFERVVQEILELYSRRLSTAKDTARRRMVLDDPPTPPKPRLGGNQLASAIPVVASQLEPSLLTMLDACPSAQDIPLLFRKRLPQLIDEGKSLFAGPGRMIVQLKDNIVVKFGPNIQEEHSMLHYVAHHTSIPVPQSLGFVVIGDTSYMFTTFIPGETLERRWPTLTKDQKTFVCSRLNDIMSELRHVAHSASTPLGSLSVPHVCKDMRMTLSVSSPDLSAVSQFHDFLVSRPFRGVSMGYLRWLRSLLRDDYRITLTHGDFHPRNVMVVDEPNGDICVSGIIDWEMGGWYPEYWEMYKALNTRSGNDESDWWNLIPEAILG
ncbi:kinase-like protein [Phlegmacium glaucopus]|nr:kinase-like protein [Phlegmacium glaucopus]